MKKNTMMRIASLLLVCVLLTTSVIGGTFAKYVTTDEASDTARVAKWGVAVAISGNLFGTDYAAVNAQDNADSIVVDSTSVSSNDPAADPDNVVAPGTKNDVGMTISLNGTPEVAYTLSAAKAKDAQGGDITAEEIFLADGYWGVMVPATGVNADTDFEANTYYTLSGTTYTKATAYATGTYYELIDEVYVDADYYPITWTVAVAQGSQTDFAAINAGTRLAAIQTDMINNLNGKSHDANVAVSGSYTLTWEWPFCQDTTDCTDPVCDSCKADTILGNLQAANANAVVVKSNDNTYAICSKDLEDGTDYNLENKFGIAVTVTQVD